MTVLHLLNGPNLFLSHFCKEDITAHYISWLNNPTTVQYSEQRHKIHTYETCLEYLDEVQSNINLFFIKVSLRVSGELIHIGNITFNYDQVNKYGEMSILIGNSNVRNKGYGREAWITAGHSLCSSIPLNIISAGTMSLNKAMLAVFKASGMAVVGSIPNRFLVAGTSADLVVAYGTPTIFAKSFKSLFANN
jgi:ribosomal-protein-alanine N-acetyltransferase